MSRKIDSNSRNILDYRPNINFVEPESIDLPAQPLPISESLENLTSSRTEVKQLASTVNTLATAMQYRVDDKCKNMKIQLDPIVDAVVVQAMGRLHPDANPYEITYQQYKECKDRMRQSGIDIGKKGILTPDKIKDASDQINAISRPISSSPDRSTSNLQGINENVNSFVQFGGYGTPEASNGMLRPEVNEQLEIIPNLDLPALQFSQIKILVNFLWKNFIKPAIPLPPGTPGLPDELVKLNDIEKKVVKQLLNLGVLVLGEKKKKKKKKTPEVPKDIPEEFKK